MTPLDLSADFGSIAMRLGLALVAGAVLGMDRELKRKPAGLRTHALVSIGSALVIMVTLISSENDNDAASRAVQGVITGIGFLGAGVIMQYEHERRVEGLTTAASIWVASGLGMACGAGLIELVLIALGATLIVLVAGEWIEGLLARRANERAPANDRADAPLPGHAKGPAPANDGAGDPPRRSR
jgi:putative Mg2+ transporter-C (MgtC) family protein